MQIQDFVINADVGIKSSNTSSAKESDISFGVLVKESSREEARAELNNTPEVQERKVEERFENQPSNQHKEEIETKEVADKAEPIQEVGQEPEEIMQFDINENLRAINNYQHIQDMLVLADNTPLMDISAEKIVADIENVMLTPNMVHVNELKGAVRDNKIIDNFSDNQEAANLINEEAILNNLRVQENSEATIENLTAISVAGNITAANDAEPAGAGEDIVEFKPKTNPNSSELKLNLENKGAREAQELIINNNLASENSLVENEISKITKPENIESEKQERAQTDLLAKNDSLELKGEENLNNQNESSASEDQPNINNIAFEKTLSPNEEEILVEEFEIAEIETNNNTSGNIQVVKLEDKQPVEAKAINFKDEFAQAEHTNITDQVKVKIEQSNLKNNGDTITVKLNPENRGEVVVTLKVQPDGSSKLLIKADNVDTLQTLKQEVKQLQESLQKIGIETGNNPEFDLQKGNQQNNQAEFAERYNKTPNSEREVAEILRSIENYQYIANNTNVYALLQDQGRVDVLV